MTMTSQQSLIQLISLRNEIAALKAVKCRMSHERVLRAADTMLPLVSRFPAGSYQRVGLCSPETRAERLACTHTMSRVRLERAISALKMANNESGKLGLLFTDELNWLDNEIHLLDHRKGESEKSLAKAVEACFNNGDEMHTLRLRKAEEEIRGLEQLHDSYVEEICALRDRVVAEIDKLIERIGTGQITWNPHADGLENGYD